MSGRTYQPKYQRVVRYGVSHTHEGWERRLLRDKARVRARVTVMREHRDEFDAIREADPDRSPSRIFTRSLRELSRRHPDEFRAAYTAALDALGYESHPCSSQSTTATMAGETSGPGTCDNRPGTVPEPGQRSEMAERTQRVAERGNR